MTEIVAAVYENGILRPLRPLELRERQMVRLQLLPDELGEEDEGEAAIRILVSAGLMRPPQRAIHGLDRTTESGRRRRRRSLDGSGFGLRSSRPERLPSC